MGRNDKARCTIQFIDVAGKPIKGLNYWLKDERDYQIAKGQTNSAGMSYELVQDVGTEVNVFVEKYRQSEWKKLNTFYLHDRFQIVRLESPKVLLESTTVEHDGSTGEYKRKTHEVKKGETLSGIAQQYGTTTRALERLNALEYPDRLAIGQVLKLPVKTADGAEDGTTSQTSGANSNLPQPMPSAAPREPRQQSSNTGVMSRLGDMGDEFVRDAKSGWNHLNKWGEDLSKDAKANWDRLIGSSQSNEPKSPTSPAANTSIIDQAEQWYNDRKAALEKAARELFTIKADRSANTTSPKDDVQTNCRTQPACIPKGTKSELIREINIRLAGFGGALPTDEFTDLTEKCIKQFQRDYMGVPETGKICGPLLVALDEFMAKYPMDKYFAQMKCPCAHYGGGKKCSGFGAGRVNEYPGIHRSVIWTLRAVDFYLQTKENQLGLQLLTISSGYRCVENNAGHNASGSIRSTINHMGLALDLQFKNNKGERSRNTADMNTIRTNVFVRYMGASTSRLVNRIFLEADKYKSGKPGATSWVHFDWTSLKTSNNELLTDKLFTDNINVANGGGLVAMAKEKNLNQLVVCGGAIATIVKSVESSDKNVRAFLDTIAKCEGTYGKGDNGYNVLVGGGLFNNEYKDHPLDYTKSAIHVRGELYSTAAGRYQIMRFNWFGQKENPATGLKSMYSFTDFKPETQDRAAILLLKRRKAYDYIKEGKIKTALQTTTIYNEWASLPGNNFKQHKYSIDQVVKFYIESGGTLND